MRAEEKGAHTRSNQSRDVPIGTTLWPITNRSLETVAKEDSKEFSLILTIAVDNREKLKGGNRYPLLLRVPVKVH